MAALIGFNKVGSPQFISWLAVPILLGLVTHAAGHGGSFRQPALLGLVIAGLTQVIYPWWYAWLLTAHPLMLGTITVRNVLTFVLLGWAVVALVRAPSTVAVGEEPDDDWLPSVWPFAHEGRESSIGQK